jgi:hypothetical protein
VELGAQVGKAREASSSYSTRDRNMPHLLTQMQPCLPHTNEDSIAATSVGKLGTKN